MHVIGFVGLTRDEIDLLNRIRKGMRCTMVPIKLQDYVRPVEVKMHEGSPMGDFWGVQFFVTGATLEFLKRLDACQPFTDWECSDGKEA